MQTKSRLTRRRLLQATAGAAVLSGIVQPDLSAQSRSSGDSVASRASSGIKFPDFAKTEWERQRLWPAFWVHCPSATNPPLVTAYRLRLTNNSGVKARLHVSADERYELFLDGRRVGRGSERGNFEHWFYETYELDLAQGEHLLVARVWSLGNFSPLAQFSRRPGFLLAAEAPLTERLSTGHADWETKQLGGYSFGPPFYVWGLAAPMTVDGGRFDWGFERGAGEGWSKAVKDEQAASVMLEYGIAPERYLKSGTLPAMLEKLSGSRGIPRFVGTAATGDVMQVPIRVADHLGNEAAGWAELLAGTKSLTIPPNTARRVIIDLADYLCAYPELVTSGGKGSSLRLHWAEGLRLAPDKWNFQKANRNEIENKYFLGMGDTFLPDGGSDRLFETLWWAAGRYVEILVRTASDPLTIQRLSWRETRYPLEMESQFSSSDPAVDGTIPLLVRGMQTCSHETFVDCPYFEQMQYVGDVRTESLSSYVMTRDDRLVRKAIYMIDKSRHTSGLTEARYPVRQPQLIPWFSLLHIGTIYEYALWRDDLRFVGTLMPGVRTILDAYEQHLDSDGLVRSPEGWNSTDSFPETERSGLIHWLLAWAFKQAAELERLFGEREHSARAERRAGEIAAIADRTFWDENKGLWANGSNRASFSEPVQCMAILSGLAPVDRVERVRKSLRDLRPTGQFGRLRGNRATQQSGASPLAPATLYSTHFLFETYRKLGTMDLFFERLQFWLDQPGQGLKTPLESYDPSRSDCHAWNSHPLFHYFATILGIRPAAPGFKTVEVRPQLGPLSQASGRLIHPAGGEIIAEVRAEAGRLSANITLPEGLTGVWKANGSVRELKPGANRI
ncbi:MAG: alpha-L-rhamnosidase [Acidobacteria bacterium]|nr:MAG: alpha-L-rhamnosidase [Acidobacteriota bacterium]